MDEVAGASHYADVNVANVAAMNLGQIDPPQLFDMRTGRWHAFAPAADMTPLESVHCSILFFSSMRANLESKALDWMTYVEQHSLTRHFTPC